MIAKSSFVTTFDPAACDTHRFLHTGNGIGDEGAEAFNDMLYHNLTITSLDLSGEAMSAKVC